MALKQIAIGFDQLFNTLLGGWADETLSARSWRQRDKSKFWAFMRRFIDALFFFEKDHCYLSYLAERERKQLPREYKD